MRARRARDRSRLTRLETSERDRVKVQAQIGAALGLARELLVAGVVDLELVAPEPTFGAALGARTLPLYGRLVTTRPGTRVPTSKFRNATAGSVTP